MVKKKPPTVKTIVAKPVPQRGESVTDSTPSSKLEVSDTEPVPAPMFETETEHSYLHPPLEEPVDEREELIRPPPAPSYEPSPVPDSVQLGENSQTPKRTSEPAPEPIRIRPAITQNRPVAPAVRADESPHQRAQRRIASRIGAFSSQTDQKQPPKFVGLLDKRKKST